MKTETSPADQVSRVLGVTMAAWGLRAPSAHALARRAPYGYEPLRARRRRFFDTLRASAQPAWLSHSW